MSGSVQIGKSNKAVLKSKKCYQKNQTTEQAICNSVVEPETEAEPKLFALAEPETLCIPVPEPDWTQI